MFLWFRMDEFHVWNEDKMSLMFGWSKLRFEGKKEKEFLCVWNVVFWLECEVWVENVLKIMYELKMVWKL